MMPKTRPIVVGVDDSAGSDAAVDWAVAHARVTGSPLRLVHAYSWDLAYGWAPRYAEAADYETSTLRHVAEQTVARAMDRAEATASVVSVDGDAIAGRPRDTLIEESRDARLVVVGSRHLHALGSTFLGSVSAGVAARAACPVVVVRGREGDRAEGSAVVVGLDTGEGDDLILRFALDYASRHRLPLRAVLCWHPDPLATARWSSERPPPVKAEIWASEALAGWQERFPDVAIHGEVIREHTAAGLVLASHAQSLLVVGSHGRHAVTGTLLGSVSQSVLHHATCPVAVVPTRPRAQH